MIISLHKYLYFSTEIHPRLLLVAIFKYSDNTQERGIKPKKVTLSLKNVIFGLVCRDYVSEISQYIRIFHIVEFSNHSPTVAWHCGIISVSYIIGIVYHRMSFLVVINEQNILEAGCTISYKRSRR